MIMSFTGFNAADLREKNYKLSPPTQSQLDGLGDYLMLNDCMEWTLGSIGCIQFKTIR
ncbi:TPA: hypothetical protein U9M35_002957 [Acinetobacter baumannii]|nr:hypothetical protein [Acinetobacter baumannii]